MLPLAARSEPWLSPSQVRHIETRLGQASLAEQFPLPTHCGHRDEGMRTNKQARRSGLCSIQAFSVSFAPPRQTEAGEADSE